MTQTFAAVSRCADSSDAGKELADGIRAAFGGEPADAIVLFASAQHDFASLLETVSRDAGTECIVGSSSAGEFSHAGRGEGSVSVLAIRSRDMLFSAGLGRHLSRDPAAAARAAVGSFQGVAKSAFPYRSALVMTDALAGYADAVVEELTVATRGSYRFFGGGAGDDGLFRKTHVFAGREVASDAIAALEILSARPLGVGVSHGWEPAGEPMRVTESHGSTLVGLNGLPAADLVEEHAQATGQRFDRADPLPFFLHNIIGIRASEQYRLRVPLGINDDGSLACAADVPTGAIVHFMRTTEASAVKAAESATRAALAGLEGARPSAAFVFDCVATRLRMGSSFDDELRACAQLLHPACFVGCNTYGQIARAEGQFGGFHNCTAVVCVLPE